MSTALAQATAASIVVFEKALGGREKVIESLSIDADPKIQTLVRLLLDPDFDDLSLSELAARAEINLTEVLRAYRNATLARAQMLAVNEIADKLPAVVKDVMTRALPQTVLCPVCKGSKEQPGRKKDDVETCRTCKGVGTVERPATVQRQRLALEIAELIKQPRNGTTLLQQFNTLPAAPGTTAGATEPGALELMQQAVSQLLYPRTAVIDIVPTPDAPAEGA